MLRKLFPGVSGAIDVALRSVHSYQTGQAAIRLPSFPSGRKARRIPPCYLPHHHSHSRRSTTLLALALDLRQSSRKHFFGACLSPASPKTQRLTTFPADACSLLPRRLWPLRLRHSLYNNTTMAVLPSGVGYGIVIGGFRTRGASRPQGLDPRTGRLPSRRFHT